MNTDDAVTKARIQSPNSSNEAPLHEAEVTAIDGVGRLVPGWRQVGAGILRIVFGVVWAIDAWLKWQPGFINNFTSYLTDAKEGQPAAVRSWIGFWIKIVRVDPHVFAHVVAVGETAVALGLLLGLFSNLTYVIGALLALGIWSTAEGFGGPYVAGSTDIGSAVIYALVFAALFLTSAGLYLGLDRRLGRRLGRWSFLASGDPMRDRA